MFNRNKSTVFYLFLVVVASVMVGMVLASRLDLSSESSAQSLAVPAVNSSPITGPVTATTFREVANAVSPAVVNIRADSMQPTQDLSELFGGGEPDDLLNRLFPGGRAPRGQGDQNDDTPRRRQQPQQPREELVRARGTGFIIDKSGLILTNNHVVEGATKILVSLYGEDEDQQYAAKVVGRDQLTDSALLQLTQKPNHDLPTVKFGDSAQMQPGDWVMAIGNPFGLDHTVSVGVISGSRGGNDGLQVASLRRADVLQTDAAINPGNSGGPLINLRGEVIGVNTAIATTGASQGNMGVGFAIPSNTIREILPQLRTGKVTRSRVGVQVGAVRLQAIDELGLKEKTGALVSSIEEGGPAEKAGVEIGDVILSWNGQPVKNSDELVRMVTRTKPGATVPVRIIRDKKERSLNITVEELDLEAENNNTRRPSSSERTSVEPEQNKGFGMTLENVTADVSRRLRLQDTTRGAVITDVDEGSPAQEDGLQAGDIIVRVGSTPVTSAVEAQRELNRVPAGGTALLRIIRRANTTKGFREIFLTVTKN